MCRRRSAARPHVSLRPVPTNNRCPPAAGRGELLEIAAGAEELAGEGDVLVLRRPWREGWARLTFAS